MAQLLVADGSADQVIGGTRDEAWSALDRPRRHPSMDHVFPGGVRTYSSGEREKRPDVRVPGVAAGATGALGTAWRNGEGAARDDEILARNVVAGTVAFQ